MRPFPSWYFPRPDYRRGPTWGWLWRTFISYWALAFGVAVVMLFATGVYALIARVAAN